MLSIQHLEKRFGEKVLFRDLCVCPAGLAASQEKCLFGLILGAVWGILTL